jgi:hypothetical protein
MKRGPARRCNLQDAVAGDPADCACIGGFHPSFRVDARGMSRAPLGTEAAMHPLRTILLAFAIVAIAACGNTYHPEYHPTSSYSYHNSNSMPVVVHPQPGQGVYVMPSPSQSQTVLPAPPPPPTPPADFPW